jgi:hypothetical protein
VITRVVKRFLLHNNRENEEIKESDFDELKQDVQTVRFEVINDLNDLRGNANEFANMVHNGIVAMSEYLAKLNQSYDMEQTLREFQLFKESLFPLMKKNGMTLSVNSKEESEVKSNLSHQDSRQTLMKIELESVDENAPLQIEQPKINKPNFIVMNLNEITHEE